jgi:antitoxin VapB
MSPMVLSIKSNDADRLARELCNVTGESITDAVTTALRERLDRVQADRNQMAHRLLAIGAAARDLPRLDGRTDDEILGYDSDGLPT